MRNIVNISLPSAMVTFVKEEMKERHFPSVSEFFRALLREHYELKLLRELRASQKEIAEGKGKVLKSFAELDEY